MKTKRIQFTNKDGHTISAKLELPLDQRPHNYAIFAHCFTCTMNLKAIRNIADSMTSQGFGILRFDFTGLGESEGDFADTNFSSQVSDLLDANNYLKDNYREATVIIGHSLGGTAALMAASKMETIKAIVTIGSPAEPRHVTKLIQSNIEEIKKEGKARVSIGGRPFTIKEQFLNDLENQALEKVVGRIKKPLLILHSPQDMVVGIAEAEKIYRYAFHPKSFVSLDGADHLMSNGKDALFAGKVIASWADRYVDHPGSAELETDQQTLVRIGEKVDKFTTQIKMGKHHLIADEPTSAGGNDYGPSPYDLLTASLGACTAMTLRMYADHKGIELDEVLVHLQHEKIHSEDADLNKRRSSKVDHIERTIELEGNLTEKQRQRMIEIADRCPVHKTLSQSLKISTQLAAN